MPSVHPQDHKASKCKILDRQFWDPWDQGGRQDTLARVRRRLDELMAGYEPTPLDDSVERDLEKILADARRHLAG